MKKIKEYSLKAALLLPALLFAAAAPVSAQAGASVNSSSESEIHSSSSNTSVHQSTELTSQQSSEMSKSAKKDAKHKKRCEAHRQGLTNKFNHIVSNSQKIQTRIDSIFSKALAYQQAKNLQPAGFDALVATAESSKATSAASIDSLKSVTPTLDCNNVSAASDVATFKTAAHQTRTDLKTYRTAVKAVLKSLEITKNTPNTEGSNQ